MRDSTTPESLKRKDYQRQYYLKNKSRLKKYAKKYYTENKERMVAQMRGWRIKRVATLVAYVRGIKESTPCADCKQSFHHISMDFDHLPGTNKLFSISQLVMKTVALDRIKKEIAKCEVVCANCHRVRTFNRRAESKTLRKNNG